MSDTHSAPLADGTDQPVVGAHHASERHYFQHGGVLFSVILGEDGVLRVWPKGNCTVRLDVQSDPMCFKLHYRANTTEHRK